MTNPALPLRVVHVLEAFSHAGDGLWGKERVVEGLMLAQRESGAVEARLIVFTPCSLAQTMRTRGFMVDVLQSRHHRVPIGATAALVRTLRRVRPAVMHTHGYKANIVGRAARALGAPLPRLVATCHGWPDESRATRFYNACDRRTSFMSDVTTVPDVHMLARFPSGGRRSYVANAVGDVDPPTATMQAEARAHFGLPADKMVIGFLGRTSPAKGILEILEAAVQTIDEPILWAIGGTGELADRIAAAALPNVRFYGYVAETDRFRTGLDAFVQASHSEGLSLALLEAMRAGLPIIATDVGSTSLAVRDGSEALVIPPRDVSSLLGAVRTLSSDREFATRLGGAARERFTREFRIDRQHREFLDLYRSGMRR